MGCATDSSHNLRRICGNLGYLFKVANALERLWSTYSRYLTCLESARLTRVRRAEDHCSHARLVHGCISVRVYVYAVMGARVLIARTGVRRVHILLLEEQVVTSRGLGGVSISPSSRTCPPQSALYTCFTCVCLLIVVVTRWKYNKCCGLSLRRPPPVACILLLAHIGRFRRSKLEQTLFAADTGLAERAPPLEGLGAARKTRLHECGPVRVVVIRKLLLARS